MQPKRDYGSMRRHRRPNTFMDMRSSGRSTRPPATPDNTLKSTTPPLAANNVPKAEPAAAPAPINSPMAEPVVQLSPIQEQVPPTPSPKPPSPAAPRPKINNPLPTAPNQPLKETKRHKGLLITLLIIIPLILVVAAGSYYYFKQYKPAHNKAETSDQKAEDDVNHITDDEIGVRFAISKDFITIDKDTLIKQNPVYAYGFAAPDVQNVMCIISNAKREKPDLLISPEALRDGTMKDIKTKYPDAQLVNYKPITLANGYYAVDLITTYSFTKDTKIKQHMVVTSDKETVTFAFCSAPESLYDSYTNKFDPFFASLEIRDKSNTQ